MLSFTMIAMIVGRSMTAPISSCGEQKPCVHFTVTYLSDTECRVNFWWDQTDPQCIKSGTDTVSHGCDSNDEADKLGDIAAGFNFQTDVTCGESAVFGLKDGPGCKKSEWLTFTSDSGVRADCSNEPLCGGGNQASCQWVIETIAITDSPTSDPTLKPTTSDPTSDPTAKPTTSDPTSDPTAKPTTSDPTSDPTAKPTTSDPTSDPTAKPTTSDPTSDPTAKPTTSDPTSDPTAKPTTSDPTSDPTVKPTTSDPTSDPTVKPTTSDPTSDPTARPTTSVPTSDPTVKPTTSDPTSDPTMRPSLAPTYTVCNSNDELNIGFLLDESGSIDYDEWQMVKTFVNRIVTFDVSPGSYVSLFEYATQESYENFLNWTKADDAGKVVITDAMNTNQWNAAGQTYTWWGTSKALDAFWNYKNSCRDESCTRNDLLFIITDGVPSDDVCPRIESRVAQSSVDIVLIIIGGAEDADVIEQQIGCLDTDGTDVYKVEEFDSDAFNAIEINIRAKTCSGLYPAGPEQENDVRFEYCPPEDPVNECTYDLGIGSNVGGGGQGGGADAGVDAAHSQFASLDVFKNKAIAADYSSYDGVVVMTWSELILCVAALITVTFGLFALCFCALSMSKGGVTAHKHVKIDLDYDTESEVDNL